MNNLTLSSPKSESEILERASQIEGLSFNQLAKALNIAVPDKATQRKGWVGQALEVALGTTAGTTSRPDFLELGIELKTIPLNHQGNPAESTFITSIPLLTIHQQNWQQSQCYAKLKKMLWVPIEGDREIPFSQRRIGRAILWSPSKAQEAILEQDWNELTWMVMTGKFPEIHAGIGQYLHIRPKAANRSSLCYGYDEQGNKIKTLPRGFYLRSQLTCQIVTSFSAR